MPIRRKTQKTKYMFRDASRRSFKNHSAAKTQLGFETLESRLLLAVVEVFAAGQTNQESIQLLIDNSPVATWNNLGGNANARQFVTLSNSTVGSLSPDRVRIAFINDLYDPVLGIDRNVRIDAIAIDGVRYETESSFVYSTGTWTAADGIVPGYRQSEFLHANGYFQYSSLGGGTGSTIEIRARGDQGGEQAELRIDGALISSFTVTTSLATYTFQAPGTVSPDKVQVFFTNDFYDNLNGIDRNLIVDYITIAGQRFETEAPSVYSTGTWRPEDGVTPGYRQSEYLNANGYFRYGREPVPGVFSLSLSEVSINENQGQLNVVVFRTGGSDGQVQVDYATTAGTASSADFTSSPGTLVFADGVTAMAFTIAIIDDSLVEAVEQFTISILNPIGAPLGAISSQVVRINDNDSVVQGILYSEGFEGAALWTTNPSSTDTARLGTWATGAPEQTSSGGTLQIGSGRNSPRGLVTGLAAGGSATAYDVDGGVTSAWSPQITLPAAADIELRFFYNFAHDRKASVDDFFSMSVVTTGGTQRVFNQTGQAANRFGSWNEAKISLNAYAGQSVRLLVQAADRGTDNLVEAALDEVVIEAFPRLPGTFQVATTDINLDENAGPAVVTVTRSQGRQGTVTVNYRTVAGSASTADFTSVQGTLTFANGELTKSVSIPIINDTIQEQLESFQFEILSPTGGALLGTDRAATITIVDNDNSVQDYLPDLTPVASTMLEQLRIDTRQIPGRKLMRFSTESANIGKGPLEMWGGSVSGTSQQVFQRIYQPNNGSRDRLAGQFVYHAAHGHIHFEGFATYNLRTQTGNQDIVASGGKTSFCLLNVRQPFPAATASASRVAGRGGGSCGQIQGISVGYSDVYESSLDGQWIDITGVANGTYWLEMIIDPQGNIQESNESNNTARVQVTILNGAVSAAIPADGAPVSPIATYASTGKGMVVALIDSGIDLKNADITSHLWRNAKEVPGDGIDNDGNGFVDDVNGFDFVDNDALATDGFGHGTFVAGLLASKRGIAQGAKIMALRALDNTGNGADSAIASSIRYAVDNGAQVIGLPLQSGGSLAIFNALAYANERNVLIVAAAGNLGASTPSYIAQLSSQFENIISAGGLLLDGSRLPESNRVGRSNAVQIDAQGIASSTLPNGRTGTFRGTSVATGFLTASAALVWATNPRLTAQQVRDVLVGSANLVGPLSDSIGTLNISAAIAQAERTKSISVSQTGSYASIETSDRDDDVRFESGQLRINGVRYSLGKDVTSVSINDPGGNDRLRLTGTNGDDSALIQTGFARLITASRTWTAQGMEMVDIDGGLGRDSLSLRDTSGNDTVLVQPNRVTLTNGGVFRGGSSFESVNVVGSLGVDTANLVGTLGDDAVYGNSNLVRLSTFGSVVQVSQFDRVNVDTKSGFDQVNLVGDKGSDQVTLRRDSAALFNRLTNIVVSGIEKAIVNGGDGEDSITAWGSSGADVVTAQPGSISITGPGFEQHALGFEAASIYSAGGTDRITLRGSTKNDTLKSVPLLTTLQGNGFSFSAYDFADIMVLGGGGVDQATVIGTTGNDVLTYSPTQILMSNSRYTLSLSDIAISQISGGGGQDVASLTDDSSEDELVLSRTKAELRTAHQFVVLENFASVQARSLLDVGRDKIRRLDSALDFLFEKYGDWIDL